MGQKVTYNPAEIAELIRKDIESQNLEVVGKISVTASLQWCGFGTQERQEAQVDTVEVSVKPHAPVYRSSPDPRQLSEGGETQAEYFGRQ